MASKKTLHLDKEHKKFLGVCAGVANYLDVEAWTVRLVFLGSTLFLAPIIISLYFFAWFCLAESSASMRAAITDNLAVKHFRTVDYKKKLYRNPAEGKFMGVCAGIADYLELSAFTVRLCFLVLFFLTGIPILVYFGAVLVLDKKPVTDIVFAEKKTRRTARHAAESEDGTANFSAGTDSGRPRDSGEDQFSKRREFQYCSRKFATLQNRLARLEAYVTSSRFKLHREFRDIS